MTAPRTPIDFLRDVVPCHSTQQFVKRVTRFTRWLDNGPQHQCSVFNFYFRAPTIIGFDGLGECLGNANSETVAPLAKFDNHVSSPICRYVVYMSPASHWQRQALLGPARPRDRTRDNQGFLGSYSRTTYAKDEAADVACRWKM